MIIQLFIYLFHYLLHVTVVGVNHAPLAQEYSKKGVPMSYRGKLWAQILNVIVGDVVCYFNYFLRIAVRFS